MSSQAGKNNLFQAQGPCVRMLDICHAVALPTPNPGLPMVCYNTQRRQAHGGFGAGKRISPPAVPFAGRKAAEGNRARPTATGDLLTIGRNAKHAGENYERGTRGDLAQRHSLASRPMNHARVSGCPMPFAQVQSTTA